MKLTDCTRECVVVKKATTVPDLSVVNGLLQRLLCKSLRSRGLVHAPVQIPWGFIQSCVNIHTCTGSVKC